MLSCARRRTQGASAGEANPETGTQRKKWLQIENRGEGFDEMLGRLALFTGIGVLSAAMLASGPLAPQSANAAASISALKFSSDMTSGFDPSGTIAPEFDGANNGVAVTFTYTDLPAGSSLSRIVRWNGEDYNWDSDLYGRTNCCSSGSGKFGFWVVKRKDADRGDLPGGAYDVRIYLNGNEIQHGGFGIKGTGGGDSDGGGNNNGNN
jgi:hypothetical protein